MRIKLTECDYNLKQVIHYGFLTAQLKECKLISRIDEIFLPSEKHNAFIAYETISCPLLLAWATEFSIFLAVTFNLSAVKTVLYKISLNHLRPF